MDIDRERFLELIAESSSISELAHKLGHPYYYGGKRLSGTAYRDVKIKCTQFGIEYKNLPSNRQVDFDIDKVKLAITKSRSIRETIKNLGMCPNNGSTNRNLKKYIEEKALDTSHFKGKGWSEGKTRATDKRIDRQARKLQRPSSEIFRKGSNASNLATIKRLIFDENLPYKCSECELSDWRNRPIRLRLDHIDGDCSNSEKENLRLLCPNCDSQTDTFCRGQRKKTSSPQWWEQISKPR